MAMKQYSAIIRTESWPTPITTEVNGFTSHYAANKKAKSIVAALRSDAICNASVSYKVILEGCCSNPFCGGCDS